MLIKGNKYVQCGWDFYEVIALANGNNNVPCCYDFAYEDWIVDEGLEDLDTAELIAFLKEQDETIIYHNEEDLRECNNSFGGCIIDDDGNYFDSYEDYCDAYYD